MCDRSHTFLLEREDPKEDKKNSFINIFYDKLHNVFVYIRPTLKKCIVLLERRKVF
jgi:hypothetical protein